MEIEYDSKFKDLTYAEANERYGIFYQSQLRMFALTQNECSQCHIRVEILSGLNSSPMKACYIDNKPKLYVNNVDINNNQNYSKKVKIKIRNL